MTDRKFRCEDFLWDNNVHDGWKIYFFENDEALEVLDNCILDYEELVRTGKGISPPRDKILRALSYVGPSDVRGVIVGHDPVPTSGHATGLAFSCNSSSHAISRMKEALVEAGIEGKEDKNDFNYEHWAKGGVLLLNSLLTVTENRKRSDEKRLHQFWLPLVTDIIIHALLASQHNSQIFGMFWGDYAASIHGNIFDELMVRRSRRIDDAPKLGSLWHYHHPTWPCVEGSYNNFSLMATQQFKIHKDIFILLNQGKKECKAESESFED